MNFRREPSMLEKTVYSVDEVADIIGVHPETIRRAIRTGRLKAFRVGGSQRAPFHVTREELERFMQAQPNQPIASKS
jgi:excisionase family DNA binding protein